MTYCAFVVCALLGDWSCIDLPRALSYIQRCRVRVSIPSPFPFPSTKKTLIRNAHRVSDVRRWLRTDARGRIARRADLLRARGAAPRPSGPHMCDPGAPTTRRMARDRALAAAHAGGVLRRLCRAYEQARGRVLWILVWCRSRRTNRLSTALSRCVCV